MPFFFQSMLRGFLGIGCLLGLGSGLASPLSFATEPEALASMVLGAERGSAVVGVWREGQGRYGLHQNSAESHPPQTQTDQAHQLYEIGSISKVFTGLLLAQAVERGELALEDQLGALLQGKAALSAPEVASITLGQLVTHTACLSRLPPDFLEHYVEDNPFASYDRRRLWATLSSLKLDKAPPCAPLYSNFGLGIVGELLSERYQKPWHVLVRENITEPLGMADTVQHIGDKAARVAPGFNNLSATPPWDFQALAGAGALRSTAADMLVFSRAVMAGASGPLGRAVERLLTPLGSFQNSQIGYAVMMRGPPDKRTYFHDGATSGYRTLWMLAPDTQEAVVALTSNAHARPDKVFVGITAARYPVTPAPTAPAQDAGALSDYAGIFRIDKVTAFIFVLQEGVLYRRMTGGGFRPLARAGANTFADAALGAQYVFTRQDDVVVRVDYTQGGGNLQGTRTDEATPTTAVVRPAQEPTYRGHFQLNQFFRSNLNVDVQVEGGQLAVRANNWPRWPVFPMADQPDRFIYESGQAELQFERDASGQVSAVVVHEGGVYRLQRVPP